jgi:hypothetical protein
MNKYKYKLREQEEGGGEEGGLKKLKTKTDLILVGLRGLTADKLMDIINNPENLKGTFVLRSDELKKLEKKVFSPEGNTSHDVKRDLFQKGIDETGEKLEGLHGFELLKDIVKNGGTFKGTPDFKKTKEGMEFWFPEKNKYNLNLVRDYFTKTQTGGENAIRTSLNPVKVDDVSLKFQPRDEKIIEKILKNAKLRYKLDYDLITQKSLQDDSYNELKEQLRKLLKENLSTAEKLIKQAEKEGHIKGDYSQMVLDTAKKIAKKWDKLDPEEQKTMRDTYYQSFLKKIKK